MLLFIPPTFWLLYLLSNLERLSEDENRERWLVD